MAHYSFEDPIVGMWKVAFLAKGNTGLDAPPDGTPIDSAIVQWHADGTEIMNSGRPAQDGNFCLGSVGESWLQQIQTESLRLGERSQQRSHGNWQPRWSNSYSGNYHLEPGREPIFRIVHPRRYRSIWEHRPAYYRRDQGNTHHGQHAVERLLRVKVTNAIDSRGSRSCGRRGSWRMTVSYRFDLLSLLNCD